MTIFDSLTMRTPRWDRPVGRNAFRVRQRLGRHAVGLHRGVRRDRADLHARRPRHYDACKPAARTTCALKPPAEQFACLSTAGRTCSTTHSAQTEPCRVNFTTCYAACGPRPATQVDFWCELDADAPTAAGKVYKNAFCAGTPGRAPLDQHARCMKLFAPSDPAIGFSLDCNALRQARPLWAKGNALARDAIGRAVAMAVRLSVARDPG
jgi:hypothetical protein